MSSESKTPARRFPVGKAAIAFALLAAAVAAWRLFSGGFPSDTTPEGAYLRVAKAVTHEQPEQFFAYLEEPAQHACYTIRDYRKKSLARARQSYPKGQQAQLEKLYGRIAETRDGADVFALYARDEGWLAQLRRDLSGVGKVETSGERATVQTVRGTRYALRRRPNGIWGLTAFTPTLVDEAERAARDHLLVIKAAEDYDRGRTRAPTATPPVAPR